MIQDSDTVLITGGSSGIGLELARRLLENGNKVLICGRSHERLRCAKDRFPGLECFTCDISLPEECARLAAWVEREHPDCNTLVNNAAIVHVEDFRTGNRIQDKAIAEIDTNLIAPIVLSKHMLPLLESNPNPKIVNITTGLIFAPRTIYPFYCATKAALHAFTLVLREQLRESHVTVVEVMFPAVDTPWHNGNPPKIAISPEQAVDEMLRKMKRGKQEIHIGGVKILHFLSRIAPGFAFKKVNSLAH